MWAAAVPAACSAAEQVPGDAAPSVAPVCLLLMMLGFDGAHVLLAITLQLLLVRSQLPE